MSSSGLYQRDQTAAVLAINSIRGEASWGRAVDGLTKLPGAFSHIVIGVVFVLVFCGPPLNFAATFLILLLAYVLIQMQASISAEAAANQVGSELSESSAVNAAASTVRTFRKVNLPLMMPVLTAGWALLFVLMVGELAASWILAGTGNPVVGFVMLDVYDDGTYSQLAALGSTVGLTTTLVVSFAQWLGRTRLLDGPSDVK